MIRDTRHQQYPKRKEMPYYLETDDREKLKAILKYHVCAECGSQLEGMYDIKKHLPYVQCKANPEHQGIERQAIPHGVENYNINSRREVMEKQLGKEISTALAKYQGVVSLTEPQAREVLITLWPEADKASPAEFYKAMMLCTQYGLNPLMRHLFLIPFWNTDRKRYEHICVQGISSNRLIASRKHHWSFLDDTPRIGSEAEVIKHYGKVNPDILRAIVKMRDIETGAEVTAWGEWPMWKTKDGKRAPNEPKGTDKGNSMVNMACTHAERKGLDMLYPADMPPSDIPVADEHYIDGTGRVLPDGEPPETTETGDKTTEQPTAQPQEPPTEPTTEKKEAVESKTSPEKQGGDGNVRDGLLNFIAEAKGYKTTKTARQYLVQTLHIEDSRIDTEPDKVLEEVKPYFK